LIVMVVELVKKVVGWWDRFVEVSSNARVNHLISSTPLIDGYEHISLEYHELLRIHKAYNRCKLIGHLWEIDCILPGLPYTYISKCASCFPHIHSQHSVQSYNLFAISERDED